MGSSRISRKPDELVMQLGHSVTAITAAGDDWPATAPTSAQVASVASDITAIMAQIAPAEAALKALRMQLPEKVEEGRDLMAKVDTATDLLYGTNGAEKINFGLDPKKTTQTPSGVPEQVVIKKIADGIHPASIFVDFDSVDGAVFEVQWFSDAPLTQQVGSTTVTNSEFEIAGLTHGNQYWVRVRAVRAGQTGPWSDQATRIAGI